jgi:hypothetical protein
MAPGGVAAGPVDRDGWLHSSRIDRFWRGIVRAREARDSGPWTHRSCFAGGLPSGNDSAAGVSASVDRGSLRGGGRAMSAGLDLVHSQRMTAAKVQLSMW